jgi:thiosulfate/3-mercaptopyruvate sulfurtransferase
MQNLGMKISDTIILYGQPHSDSSMTRVFHILTAYGFNDVTVLDGGLLKFEQQGYPTTPGIDYTGPASEIQELADPTPYLIKMEEVVEFALGKKPNMQLIDARGSASFNGNDPNLAPGIRQGHVPGAINIPADTFIDASDDTFIKYNAMIDIFNAHGIDQNKDIVVMCKTGISATVDYVALTFAGFTGMRLYDGSWTEYGSNDTPSVPVIQKMPFYIQPSMMPVPQYIIMSGGQKYMAITDDSSHLPVYKM